MAESILYGSTIKKYAATILLSVRIKISEGYTQCLAKSVPKKEVLKKKGGSNLHYQSAPNNVVVEFIIACFTL